MPRPSLGRERLDVRITPQARIMLGEHPSERAREQLEEWAALAAAAVSRDDVQEIQRRCADEGDGQGVETCGRALASDVGSVDWYRAAALVIGLREADAE